MGLLASKKRRRGVLGAAVLAVPVGGLLVGLAVSGSVRGQTSAAQADGGFIPRATVVEIMDAMVMPSADVLWNAVGVSVTSEGVIENLPETDEDWQRLRWAAVTMAEGGNALLVPGRKVAPAGTVQDPNDTALSPDQIEARIAANRAAWVGMVHVLDAAVVQALDAIEARDADTLSEVGGTIDAACESCHLQFWYPEQ